MATPFRLKRSAIEGKRPAESDLQRGELALNTYDGYLYTEREGVGLSTVTNLTPWYENYGGGSIYYSNSVGIGTTVPQYNLDVRKGSIGGYDTLVAQHSDVIKEIAVTVASKTDDHRYQGQGSGQGYVLDGIQSPILTLTPGRTYRFNLSSSDMSSHPFRFYLDAAKSVQYTTNVTTTATYAQIVVNDETPNVIHYQCSAHGYMGNALVLNSNVVNSTYAATLRNGLDVTSGNVDITQNLNVTGNLDVDGATTLDGTTIDGLLDINAGGQANTFKVEDLTAGRVVIAGTGGEIEDSGNLLFNGTDLSASSLIVSDLTDGRVVLAGGSGAVEDNANLKFNTTTSEFEVVGHTVLDSINVSGLSTFSANIDATGHQIQLTDVNLANSIFHTGDTDTKLQFGTNHMALRTGGSVRLLIDNTGINVTGDATVSSDLNVTSNATIGGNLTVTGDVGIAGTLTYEDVTNIDSVGIITARNGITVSAGTATFQGAIDANGDLDVDGHTNLDNVSIAGVVTATTFVGALTGNATSSDTVDISGAANANTEFYVTFSDTNGAAKTIKIDDGLRYNASSNILTASYFSGNGANLSGLNGSNIASGTVPVARIGTGTKSTSTFYRGDGTFATVTAPAITAINNASDNRIVTSDGGTTVTAEQNLFFADVSSTNRMIMVGTNDSTTARWSGTRQGVKLAGSNPVIYFQDTDNNYETYVGGSGGNIYIGATNGGMIRIQTGTGNSNANRWFFDANGHLTPAANNSYDLGSSSYRVRNIYTNDLNLSNKGSENDVDGTWGDFTIQEGESDLFLINKRNGKKYKFNLTEVS